jgi:DNA (cytosine-5)-methyltransferase 1
MVEPLIAVSLFSGCLGFDYGLEKVGIQTRVCVEKDPDCRESIKLNRPDIKLFEDIYDVSGQELKDAAGGRVDVLVGGPPCQSFSTIGKRGCLKDPRGKLTEQYLRILRAILPETFVLENVVGILSAKRGGTSLVSWLTKQFKKLGYYVSLWKMDANDYGTGQKRVRVLIVGSRRAQLQMPAVHRSRKTLGQLIGDLEHQPGEGAQFSTKMRNVLKKIPEGGNWKSLSPRSRKKAMGAANTKSGGLTAFYRRLSYQKPCPTLLTSPTQRATTLCHPKMTRPLSVAEYRRIQGFPDSWKLSGTTAHKYRQLGNAVPVGLAMAIGRVLVGAR